MNYSLFNCYFELLNFRIRLFSVSEFLESTPRRCYLLFQLSKFLVNRHKSISPPFPSFWLAFCPRDWFIIRKSITQHIHFVLYCLSCFGTSFLFEKFRVSVNGNALSQFAKINKNIYFLRENFSSKEIQLLPYNRAR